MKCHRCETELLPNIQICHACGFLNHPAPSPDAIDRVNEAREALAPELVSQLDELVAMFDDPDEFIRHIMVGSCPKCGSDDTGNCEDDPESGNPFVNTCYQCGAHWCDNCGDILEDAGSCDCVTDFAPVVVCGSCKSEIDEDQLEVLVGIRYAQGANPFPQRGHLYRGTFTIEGLEREVLSVLVPPPDAPARQEGFDVLVPVCSPECISRVCRLLDGCTLVEYYKVLKEFTG